MTAPIPSPLLRQTLVALLLLGLILPIGIAAQAQEAPTTDTTEITSDEAEDPVQDETIVEASTAEVTTSLSLADIPAEKIAFEKRSREIHQLLDDHQALNDLEEKLESLEKKLESVLEHANPEALEQLPVSELMALDTTALENEDMVNSTRDSLDSQARGLASDLDDLQQRSRYWKQLEREAVARRAPEELLQNVWDTQIEIDELTAAAEKRRNEILIVLARVTRLGSQVAEFRSKAAEYQLKVRRLTLLSEDQPLWRLHQTRSGDSLLEHLWLQLKIDVGRMSIYCRQHLPRILLTFFGTLGLVLYWLGNLREPAKNLPGQDGAAAVALRVIHPAWPLALSLSILLTLWLSPAAPRVYYETLFFILPLPAAKFALQIHGNSIRLTIVTLAVAIAVLTWQPYLELAPLVDRLVLIAQCGSVSLALARDLKHGSWGSVLGRRWRKLQLWSLSLSAVVLALVVLLAIVGTVSLAREIRTGVLGSLGFAIVFSGLYRGLDSLVKTWVRTAAAKSHAVVRNHPKTIYLYINRALFALTLLAWVASSLYAFNIYNESLAWISGVLTSGLKIGAANLTVGAVLVFVLTITGSFVVAKIICLLLDEQFLPKLHLKRGVPYAISTLARYLILFGGFLLAIAAAGLDLSQMTLLVGALGVGIGFGLQNVVNNFVSGLILLFERPVQVGDAVEVGNLLGEVTNIGIRASTVRTYQGAEVIVPNGDLISQQVINWTLSNRRRRVDIVVGVAYGTDPQKVIHLLLNVASSHSRVDDDPEPSVLFSGFGDSSLDFQLRCWVNHFEDGFAVASDLRIEINRVLDEAGIEIPFPQRDLHIRTDLANSSEVSSKSDVNTADSQ